MTEISLEQVVETIRATQAGYHKLTIIAGPSGTGKTRLLKEVANRLQLPWINLSLALSQRLLSQTRRQRALKAEEAATDVVDEHIKSGVCLDNTELLFDSALRLNPLAFLQDISRNRLIVASWNGSLNGGELRFGYTGHPDFFSQPPSGYPIVCLSENKFRLYLTT